MTDDNPGSENDAAPSEEVGQQNAVAGLSRKAMIAIALVTVLIVGGAGIAFATRGGDKSDLGLETSSDPENPQPVATTTIPGQVDPMPDPAVSVAPRSKKPAFIVASSESNRVVLIDSQSGKTTKVLASYTHDQDISECRSIGRSVSLSPDNKTVYFDVGVVLPGPDGFCGREIRKVAVAGGDSSSVTAGQDPRISPDGTKVAFVRVELDHQGITLITRDLASGQESVIRQDGPGHVWGSANIAWSPDGKKLAYDPVYCACGDKPETLMSIVDLASKQSKRLSINEGLTGDRYAQLPTFIDNDSVLMLTTTALGTDDPTQPVEGRAIVVNANTSAIERVILESAMSGELGTASDASGENLLLINDGKVLVSSNGSSPIQLATGVTGVDW